ncbi:hypothetical protein ACULTK_002860 [Yersinia enterocolitica]|uniref:Uncharacterized protein n=1 Tax=Yersinia intermedia TaxID=631 RepID=A0A0T9M8M0_YERIN|nr:hypothetical protein [Yersinia intermedia]CNF78980.1 Uncharacterised protein [Yersinia intermedia]
MKKSPPVTLKNDYTRLLTGEAEKINPHATGMLHWELAADIKSGERWLRITANDSGGLFSREWVALSAIRTLLKEVEKTDFHSTVLRPLFSSASRNNAGFLAAILRSSDICLTEETTGQVFSHRCYTDWEKRIDKLMQLTPTPKD